MVLFELNILKAIE